MDNVKNHYGRQRVKFRENVYPGDRTGEEHAGNYGLSRQKRFRSHDAGGELLFRCNLSQAKI